MPDQTSIVLSIAGFDPCGGAGILADIQTLQQCEVQGMAVQTALTAQNEEQVTMVNWHRWEDIEVQLDTLFKKYSFDVAKIGIIENLTILKAIVSKLRAHNPTIFIVWDPILKSSSGFDFLKGLNHNGLAEVLKQFSLITPNLPEYELLKSALGDQAFSTNLLIKGGHSEGDDTSDKLNDPEGNETIIAGQRIKGKTKHGTGCVLSSAIAAGISKGMKLKTACIFAKKYVEGYLNSGINQLGAHYTIKI